MKTNQARKSGDRENEKSTRDTYLAVCSWNELVTSDQQAALTFYSSLFGWTSSGSMAMGDAGDYIFLQNVDTAIGAMMAAPEQDSQPY